MTLRLWGRGRRLGRLAGLQAVALLAAWAVAKPPGEPQRLPSATLEIAGERVRVGLALTQHQRRLGYMYREHVPDDEAMLFVFDERRRSCMWMRNTPAPLTVAWLTDEGKIVNTADMRPFSDQSHCSEEPVRLALEMRRGWLAERDLGKGSVLEGLQPLLRRLLAAP